MRKFVLFAVFVLFPALAFAQITISPTQIAYNANAEATQPTLTITGTALAGNVDTLVEFTYSDGAFTDVFASTASSTTVTVLVPPSVFGLAGTWTVRVIASDDTGFRFSAPATLAVFANQAPEIFTPEVVTAEATSASGANVTFDVVGFSFVDPL